ncbi:hypothetical protein ACFL5G_05685 [Candidatus Margulisiibacteriota bacterium]
MAKKLLKFFIILYFLSLAWPGTCLEPFDVMDRYTGARALAMGGAFIAVANDLSAPYWNPAGLTQVGNNQLGTTYINLFDMADRLSIDGIYHLQDGGIFAANYVQEGMQNIPKTVDIGGTGIQVGAFDEYKRAVNISLARKYDQDLSWGTNARFLFNSIDTDSAYGGSIDAGILWSRDKIFYFGAVARNIFSKLEWSTSEIEYLERKLILGISVREMFFDLPAVFALDLEINPYSENRWYAGTELWLTEDVFAFRFGNNSLDRWTFGLGLVYANFTCDFCYWKQEYLGEQYLISLGFSFGPPGQSKSKQKRTFAVDVTPTDAKLYPGKPLIIRVKDPGEKYKKAAVSFPENDVVKNMKKVAGGYKLIHYFKIPPPLMETRLVKIYVQNKAGEVTVEEIQYTIHPRPIKPVVSLPRNIWYKGESLQIKLTVPKTAEVETAVVEFDEYHQKEMQKTAPGIYLLKYPLSANLKNGVYAARVLVKIKNQPVFEKKVDFTVKTKAN